MALEGQGILTIGSRATQTEADKQVKQKVTLYAKNAQEAARAATEAIAAQQELLDRIRVLSAELAASEAEVARLRARLQAVENGVWVSMK
jgi:uncharacterized protein involved in exopolysaccharide biosynthesis